MKYNTRDLLKDLKRLNNIKTKKTNITVNEVKYSFKQQERLDLAINKFKAPLISNQDLSNVMLTPSNVIAEQHRAHLENEITSGIYFYNKNKTYLDNYVTFLENIGASSELINKIKSIKISNDNTIVSDILPKMGDYYYPLKRGYIMMKQPSTRGRRAEFTKMNIDIGESINDILQGVEESLKLLEEMGFINEE